MIWILTKHLVHICVVALDLLLLHLSGRDLSGQSGRDQKQENLNIERCPSHSKFERTRNLPSLSQIHSTRKPCGPGRRTPENGVRNARGRLAARVAALGDEDSGLGMLLQGIPAGIAHDYSPCHQGRRPRKWLPRKSV